MASVLPIQDHGAKECFSIARVLSKNFFIEVNMRRFVTFLAVLLFWASTGVAADITPVTILYGGELVGNVKACET